jgi:fatty acid kinase
MNPSTEEILAAIEAADAPEVVVLPNNSNVTLAAERTVDATAKRAVVVPSTSIPAGLAAVLAYDASRSADENDQSMREAIGGVRSGEVAVASRDATLDGVAVGKGSWFGAADGVAVACGGSLDDVAEVVAERLLDNGADVLTILTGADAPPLESLRARLQERHPLLDIEVREGGQPHYPLLFWA